VSETNGPGTYGAEEELDLDGFAATSGEGDDGFDGSGPEVHAAEVADAEGSDAPESSGEATPLEHALRERDEYLDALRRLQAEFDNFRKRTARQQAELLDRATESLVERLLPVLDALDLAVVHATPEGDPSDPSTNVLAQIATLLRDTLVKEGLERVAEVEVDFDPTIHDAVAHVPARESGEDGNRHLIDDVLRPGYLMKGRVLRPAMVRVRG
jgi:molecular chaperone GrpE